MKHLIPIAVLLAGCAGGTPASPDPTPAPAKTAAAGSAQALTPSEASDDAPSPEGTDSGQLAGYDGVFSNGARLTPEQVAAWPREQLSLKRNEIYARYGRPFKTESIRAHFQAKPWYREVASYSDAQLTPADKANAALIRSFEGEAPERTGQVGALWFVDASSLVISDTPSMYGFVGQERRYVTRGADRLITWTGPERLDLADPGVKEAELWTWSGQDWERQPLPRPNG